MILPAVLIALAWAAWLRPSKALEQARTELTTAQAGRPQPMDFMAADAEAKKAREEADAIKKQNEEWTARWETIKHQRSVTSGERVLSIESVTRLLDRSGLRLLGESPQERNGSLPPEFDETVKRLSDKNPSFKAQLWKVDFVGQYRDVVLALGKLPEACPLAIPIELNMHPSSSGSAARRWSLVLWL